MQLDGIAVDECRRCIQQNITIGVCGPGISRTRHTKRYIPAHACLRSVSNSSHSTCLPAMSMSPLRSSGASTRTWLIPTTSLPHARAGKAQMQVENDMLASTRVPSRLTDHVALRGAVKRRVRNIVAYFDAPTPRTARPKLSSVASTTCAAPLSDTEILAATSSEHSSKSADSNPNCVQL